MREIFLLVLSFVLIFILTTGSQANAVFIDFSYDDSGRALNVGDDLLDQYDSYGIYFRDSLTGLASPAANIASETTAHGKKLNPYSYGSYVYILFDTALELFSSEKWEPKDTTGGHTVYFEFLKGDGTWVSHANSADKYAEWVTESDSFNAGDNVLAMRILGANKYYLDNMNFTFASPISNVPEPFTFLLLGLGITGLAGMRRKLKQ